MNPSTLIVQVSDVHFASELYPRTGAQPGPSGKPSGLFTLGGLRPHDVGACRDLCNAIDAIRRSVRPAQTVLAVTGDLTTQGDDSEFALATSFLRYELAQTRSQVLGLAGRFSRTFMVPGNHDHWRGTNLSAIAVPGANGSIHGAWFDGPAWLQTIQCPPLQLQIMGIDSCGNSAARFAASGCIAPGDVAVLRREIASANQKAANDHLRPVRILLMHHPLHDVPPLHEFDTGSKRELERFFRGSGIHAYLTGHTHGWKISAAATPVEMRCGTTLQSGPPGGGPSKQGQIFLTHQIRVDADDDVTKWDVTVYQRIPGKTGYWPISVRQIVIA